MSSLLETMAWSRAPNINSKWCLKTETFNYSRSTHNSW